MKKLLSILLSTAMLTALLTVPAFADYTAADYDVEALNLTFDDGTAEGRTAEDGKALQIGETATEVFNLSGDTTGFDSVNEFFLSFDFKFDTNAGGFDIHNTASSNAQGPLISYEGTGKNMKPNNLVTQTSSDNYQALGTFIVGDWYTMEIEGATGGKGATGRLYSYSGGTKTLVQETPSMNFRNLGSENRHFIWMKGNNVTVDNVLIVQEKPDTIEITTSATNDEMDAGQNIVFDYSMKRGNTAFTKYPVEWSIKEGESATGVSINGTALVANIKAPQQTVTLQATATFGTKQLVGEKQITINGVDTTNELFDAIEITGPDTVKAGTTSEYTFTAKKNGVDVTDSLTDEDYAWSIYTADDLNKNNNKAITITGGKTAELAIDDSVIAQKLNVRLSTATGVVYQSKLVNVEFSDSQAETVIVYNACEDSLDTVTRVESIDGSWAYKANSSTIISLGSERSEYTLTEFDARFSENNSFVYWEKGVNGGSNWNSSFHLRDGALTTQSGGSNYPPYGISATTEDWFHFEVLYSPDNASCIVTKYNSDGTLGEPIKKLDIERRNAKAYGSLELGTGVIIDNIKVSVAAANQIELTAPDTSMFSGGTMQLGYTVSRNGLPILTKSGLTWKVLDGSGKQVIDDSITISDDGLLTVGALVPTQTIKVVLESAAGEDFVEISVQKKEYFKITNIGVNEDDTKIVKLFVEKKYEYNDKVTFIIAIYNEDGRLVDVKVASRFGDSMALGENDITFDIDLPENFNPETYTIKVMTWTSF